MRALLQELRRSPEIIAIGVLCLALGVTGSESAPRGIISRTAQAQMQRIWMNHPGRDTLTIVHDRLQHLSPGDTRQPDCLPRLDF